MMINKFWLAAILGVSLLSACGGDNTPIDNPPPVDNPTPVDNPPPVDPPPDNNPPPSSPPVTGNPGLSISEIVAKSADDDFLDGDDWIELFNGSDQTVNLSDYALADDNSGIIALPDLHIAPGEYIVIAAVDSEHPNPPFPSVPFKLGSDDEVTLYFGNEVIDFIDWADGEAPEGTSYGWLNGELQLLTPTPGGPNQAYSAPPTHPLNRGNPTYGSALRISELVARSGTEHFLAQADWVELINTGNAPIDLSEYYLADDDNDLERLPAVQLQPGEYFIVQAGDDPAEDGIAFVSFGLGREDSLSLYRGQEEVDFVIWGRDESMRGRSYGRLDHSDPHSDWQILYPTPGYANVPYVLFSQDEVFTVRVDIPQSDWRAILANPEAEQYYPANFELNGGIIENVGFRVKGQGSLRSVGPNSDRYGFKVDINEYQDQKFMGMKKLVLNQSFADPSFMRDILAYKLMKEAGVPAPETSFVDLWVAGEHMGLYQLIEMVDGEFVEKYFPDDDDNDLKGDLYKGELFQTLVWQGDNINSYSGGLRLKTNRSTEGTPEEGRALIAFLDSINNGSDRLAHVDTDLMVRYLAASVLTGNMDSPIGATANNFYLYEQRNKGQFTMIPWDYNLAYGMWGDGPALNLGGGFGGGFGGGGFGGGGFGGSTGGQDCRIVNHVIDNPVHDLQPRPLFEAILANPQLRQQYRDTLQWLLDTAYDPDYLEGEIMRMADLIDPYVQADPTKFFTYDEWRMSLTQDLPSNSDNSAGRGANIYGPAPGLMNFIRQKANSVQRQLNGEIPSTNNGVGGACPP